MLKDILEERGISVYKLSKETGISYSTINDIVIEKTDIKNTSANMLYRLAKYLEVSMEALYEDSITTNMDIYLSNDGRNVILEFAGKRVQYLGPKNLISFHRVNRVDNNVLYVDCYFLSPEGKMYCEEDYIDLSDVLSDYEYVIDGKYTVILGTEKTSEKESIINNSLLISDNIAVLFYANPDIPDKCVQAVSVSKPKARAVIRMADYAVVSSTMSKAMLNRAVDAVRRNVDEINDEVEEVLKYA